MVQAWPTNISTCSLLSTYPPFSLPCQPPACRPPTRPPCPQWLGGIDWITMHMSDKDHWDLGIRKLLAAVDQAIAQRPVSPSRRALPQPAQLRQNEVPTLMAAAEPPSEWDKTWLRAPYKHTADRDAVSRAAKLGDAALRALKEGGSVGINAFGGIVNWAAVHSAAFNGNLQSLRLLLQHGARCDFGDRAGTTPVDMARGRMHMECVCLLEEHLRRSRQPRQQSLLNNSVTRFSKDRLWATVKWGLKAAHGQEEALRKAEDRRRRMSGDGASPG